MSRLNRGPMTGLALLIMLTSTTVTAQENRLVSEGECYYAAGERANSVYIPCGNDAFGVYACCKNGDTCLSSNACYNAEFGDTYIAGCTDSTYSNAACGNKGAYGDLQWASLVRCFVSNDTSTNDEEWAACNESNQPIVTSHDGGCECTGTPVFRDNPSLTNLAVLPAATGQSISFQPGHTPPADLTPTAQSVSSTSSSSSSSSSSASSSSSSTATTGSSRSSSQATSTTTRNGSSGTSAASTSSPTSNAEQAHSGLSTGAEAGIGVGVGLGVLLICGILFLLYRRRVKKRYAGHHPSKQPFVSPYSDSNTEWQSQAQTPHMQQNMNPAAADMQSPAWAGNKAELPAEESSALMGARPMSTYDPRPGVAEVEGSSMTPLSHGGGAGGYSNTLASTGVEPSDNSTNQGTWIPEKGPAPSRKVHELP